MKTNLWYHPDKYAQKEEERRFLLAELPPEVDPEGYVRITDHYVPGTRLRLRRMISPAGETVGLKMTQKYWNDDQATPVAMITNIYLNEAEYAMLETLGGLPIVKRRYPYRVDVYLYSIDVFEETLDGLIMMEIENKPGLNIHKLPAPTVATREVTGDPFFDGGALAEIAPEAFQAWLAGASSE